MLIVYRTRDVQTLQLLTLLRYRCNRKTCRRQSECLHRTRAGSSFATSHHHYSAAVELDRGRGRGLSKVKGRRPPRAHVQYAVIARTNCRRRENWTGEREKTEQKSKQNPVELFVYECSRRVRSRTVLVHRKSAAEAHRRRCIVILGWAS